ncbi:MAG: hypothetical protein ACYDH6_08675 [Acidimicrobiales bacterium]
MTDLFDLRYMPRQSDMTLALGVVTGVQGPHVFIKIPALSVTSRMGPCLALESVTTPGETTDSADGHTHGVLPPSSALKAGDVVLVGFLEGSRNRPIVLGRVAS